MHSTLALPGAPSRAPRAFAAERSSGFWSEIEAGHEPPLDLGAPTLARDHHRPSLRWLGASVLVGIAGALLLGAAIYVSSQGQITFAEIAEFMPAQPARDESGTKIARKGDKLVRVENVAAAKQTFKSPMTIRSGDREVIKIRNFTRIATGLSLTSGVYAVNIPPFNPMRFFAVDADRAVPDTLTAETSDAEVSVLKSDLSTVVLDPSGPTITDRDAEADAAAYTRSTADAERKIGVSGLSGAFPAQSVPRAIPGASLGRAAGPGLSLAGVEDPAFRSIEVRVVPENVTDLPKSVGRRETGYEETVVGIRRGETVESSLRALGASPDDARQMIGALGIRDRSPATLEGMQMRVLLAPPPAPREPRPLARVVLFGERGIEGIAARNDRGFPVSVSLPQAELDKSEPQKPASSSDDEEEEGSGVTLYESLYETALKHDLPRQTVEELIRIFGYDVDFQRRVAPGDGFEIFYATDDDAPPDRIEILGATLTLGQDVKRVFRYQGEDGTVDYFDEQGRSLKKFLLRKPVIDAKLSSGFGTRYHPILGYSKLHTGVDWAARVGTPILAAGNGTVIKAGWDAGYGRRTEVQHANGYVSTYNHQSAFARGIAPGAKVRQGQVIGYIGSTGLSTGAHLHYEVIVNGRFVDPMKIRVPRGRELDGAALASFNRQREQIEAIRAKAAGPDRFARAAETR